MSLVSPPMIDRTFLERKDVGEGQFFVLDEQLVAGLAGDGLRFWCLRSHGRKQRDRTG